MFTLKTLLNLILTLMLVFLLTGCVLVLERTTEPEVKEEIEQESELPDWLLLSHRDTKVTLLIENDQFHMTKNLDDEIDRLLTETESVAESTGEDKEDLPEQTSAEPMPDETGDSYIVEPESVNENNEQEKIALTKSQRKLASNWEQPEEEKEEIIWWDLEDWELGPPQRNFTHETRGSN